MAYNSAYTGQEIDEAVGKAKNAITAAGGGAAAMAEALGSGPYSIEFTEETDPGDIAAAQIAYDNTGTGMEAENVQAAIVELRAAMASTGGPGVPVGSMLWQTAETAPEGFLVCDGSLVSRMDYADLFAAIGTTFGAGDGSETFALPDLRAAFVRGAGTQDGYSATFGLKQQATSVNPMYASIIQIGNYDKLASGGNRSAFASNGAFDTAPYYRYFRPYNIALTPIIKY